MGGGDTDLLVALLHEAARLEHGLLDSYLFAACSLKSLPEEFATLPDGRENRRRAIQFERVRSWKQAILEVAHEEMLHLHYVECLIRALGAEPYLGLPPRDPETGNWVFSSWTAHMSGEPAESGGMQVPVEPLTPANIRRFVLYESTDALQDDDPDAQSRAEDLFARLHDFELELRIESVLTGLDDGDEREALQARLRDLYVSLAPAEPPASGPPPPPPRPPDPSAAPDEVRFQSIADLYSKAILPLYNEAMDYGQVPHANPGLNAELRDPNFAVQGGLLPVLPVHRDKNFDQSSRDDLDDPLRGFRSVEDVIAEIVEEGEGQQGFEDAAEALLDKVAELGGARGYRDALSADAASTTPSPPWLVRVPAAPAVAPVPVRDDVGRARPRDRARPRRRGRVRAGPVTARRGRRSGARRARSDAAGAVQRRLPRARDVALAHLRDRHARQRPSPADGNRDARVLADDVDRDQAVPRAGVVFRRRARARCSASTRPRCRMLRCTPVSCWISTRLRSARRRSTTAWTTTRSTRSAMSRPGRSSSGRRSPRSTTSIRSFVGR